MALLASPTTCCHHPRPARDRCAQTRRECHDGTERPLGDPRTRALLRQLASRGIRLTTDSLRIFGGEHADDETKRLIGANFLALRDELHRVTEIDLGGGVEHGGATVTFYARPYCDPIPERVTEKRPREAWRHEAGGRVPTVFGRCATFAPPIYRQFGAHTVTLTCPRRCFASTDPALATEVARDRAVRRVLADLGSSLGAEGEDER